ncbi:MAG: hypothetical protein R3211_05220 [Balneolaceae bacterium]|nr:hypothetical protein [Balneolaceae bacterium]
MPADNSGKLTKLKIIPYKDAKYSQKDEEKIFKVMFNPQEYSLKYEIENDDSQGIGTSATEINFKKMKPQDLSLDFTLDGTGASGELIDVPDRVQDFLGAVYEYNGDEHEPRNLRVNWGTLSFKCVLKTVSVKFTLFDSDGKPIRAKISAAFIGFVEDELRVAKEDSSSPDLTHQRIVHEGDTLPLMCHRIYGDAGYYLQVAEVNNLTNFRNLETGRKLIFPPLKG